MRNAFIAKKLLRVGNNPPVALLVGDVRINDLEQNDGSAALFRFAHGKLHDGVIVDPIRDHLAVFHRAAIQVVDGANTPGSLEKAKCGLGEGERAVYVLMTDLRP